MARPKFLQRGWMAQAEEVHREEPEPLEGTRMDLFNSIIPSIFADWGVGTYQSPWGTASLAERVWVTSRCQHMNASQIAAMPLEWHGPPAATTEPAWVSSPDPAQFPNGIGDAMYAITDQLYGWGWSLQYITDYYEDGYPRRWTVIPSASCEPRWGEDGRKVYKLGETELDPARVVQIDRNPTTAAHGTSAIRAYAQAAYGLLSASSQEQGLTQGGIPQAVLKSLKKITKEQAAAIKSQWDTATAANPAGVRVIGPDLELQNPQFNPADIALLESQEWNAKILATAYGIPAVLLNMALQGGLTYQNPLALMQMWWLTELRTTAKRIVDAFTAQMLPRGQWVSVDASDVTVELTEQSDDDDPQLSQVANASPAQTRPVALIGGGRP